MRSFLLGIFFVSLLIPAAYAQQDPHYTMFMFNRFGINPAYAGAYEALNITGVGRAQWVGIDGAPNTTMASAHGYVNAIHGGVGGYLIGDQLGPISTMGAKVAYAYHLNIGETSKLQIGVGGGIYQKKLDGSNWKYDQDQGIDNVLPTGITTSILPDLDAGLYFHKALGGVSTTSYPLDKYFIGVSVTHLLEPSLSPLLVASGSSLSRLRRDIHASAGYTFDLGSGMYLQPNAYYRMAGPLKQWDLNMTLYISPMAFGIAYRGFMNGNKLGGRGGDAVSGIIGFNASPYMFFGYSYDYTVSNLGSATSGSHEIVVSYTFPTKYKHEPPVDGVRGGAGGLSR